MSVVDSNSKRALDQLKVGLEVGTSSSQMRERQVSMDHTHISPARMNPIVHHEHAIIREDDDADKEENDLPDNSNIGQKYADDLTSIDSDSTGSVKNKFDPNDSTFHYNLKSALETLQPSNVGLACLPIQKQVFTKRKGAYFTMLLVGQSGLGKTSFINTLFDSVLIDGKDDVNFTFENRDDTATEKTTSITKRKLVLDEDGFELRLTVIDTPGFGDYINNKYCWYPISKYVDEQYRSSIYQENQPNRSEFSAGQIHVCIYFISPSGNSVTSLTQLDIECMKNLCARVNLIPVISKADGFTYSELKAFRQSIKNTLKDNNISVCSLMDKQFRSSLVKEVPYSLINSIEYHTNAEGEFVRGRKYKWGVAEVLNPAHCDFAKLRELLMGTNMVDLLSSTEAYFENYRREFLSYRLDKSLKLAVGDDDLNEFGISKDARVTNAGVPISRDLMSTDDNERKTSRLNISNVDNIVETNTSINVLKLLNKLSIYETEKELVELNPEYLDLETKMKKKFTDVVQSQNQKFKDWKRALYERQDALNKDIENIHKRVIKLQEEVREHPLYGTLFSGDSVQNSVNSTNTVAANNNNVAVASPAPPSPK